MEMFRGLEMYSKFDSLVNYMETINTLLTLLKRVISLPDLMKSSELGLFLISGLFFRNLEENWAVAIFAVCLQGS